MRVVLEFQQPETALARFSGLLEGTKSWVSHLSAGQVDAMLFAQAARTPGLVKFYFDVLTFSRHTDEVYRIRLPEAWLQEHDGAPMFGQLFTRVLALREISPGMVLLGFVRDNKVRTNPGLDTILGHNDALLILAKDPPDLDKLLRQQSLQEENRS